MDVEVSDMLTRRRERLAAHFFNMEYVARFHEHLRKTRGYRSQMQMACMADVVQSYISRVEAGSTLGIGYEALCRILEVYRGLESANAD